MKIRYIVYLFLLFGISFFTSSCEEQYNEEGLYTYETWDADNDMILTEDEFYRGVYILWDTDKDGQIEQAEYNSAVWEI